MARGTTSYKKGAHNVKAKPSHEQGFQPKEMQSSGATVNCIPEEMWDDAADGWKPNEVNMRSRPFKFDAHREGQED